MVYNKKDFCEHTNRIIPKGFTRLITNENVLIRKWDGRIERLDYTGREYFPHGAYFQGVIASISFYSVENILNDILDKYNIQQHYGSTTIRSVLNNIEGVDYSKFNIEIHDESSFQTVAEEIKKIVEYGAIPFFEKYQTLKDVADLLADKKPEEVVPYIQGAILFPKTILILKMSNHPKYKEKLIEFHDVLAIYANKKDIYKQMMTLYDDLFADDLKGL